LSHKKVSFLFTPHYFFENVFQLTFYPKTAIASKEILGFASAPQNFMISCWQEQVFKPQDERTIHLYPMGIILSTSMRGARRKV
jgi:hypothetical protein